MARNKKISTEELKKYVTEFYLEHPNEKITIPKVGEYIRTVKGKDVGDYLIRRDPEIKQMINDLKEKSENFDNAEKTVVVYHPLDAELFIRTNSKREDLIKALTARDAYYSKITASAAKAFEENKKLKAELRTYKAQCKELKNELKEKVSRRESKEIREKDAEIASLIALLKDYVYPDAANALLAKEGLLEVNSTMIDPERLEENTIHADTIIQNEEHKEQHKEQEIHGKKLDKSVEDLLKGFD